MLEKIEVVLRGVSPLLMHNGRLADPTNPHTRALRELTRKRQKTDEDLLEIRRVEWRGGLYTNADDRVSVPADAVLAVVIEGARKGKQGKQAAAAVFETQPFYPLVYSGPADLDRLYEQGRFVDYRSVVVQRNRTMRARPIFPDWELPIALQVNADVMNSEDVLRALRIAGEVVGLCDFRPRYGRFSVDEQ